MIRCTVDRCVGCRMCEVICSDSHFGAVSPALTRIRVAKLEETGVDMAVSCLSCEEKPCLECPTDALSVGESRQIILDEQLCGSCGECIDACPVGAVGGSDGSPLFCDLCDGSPACVDSCPTGALIDDPDAPVSLEAFMRFTGNPAQKRANYVKTMAHSMRGAWLTGRRVDG